MDEAALHRLRDEIKGELSSIEQTVRSFAEIVTRLQQMPDDRVVLDAGAVRLHAFYNGIERCLLRIIRRFEGAEPDGESWHRDLLARVSREEPPIRGAILSPETVTALDKFRAFRHRFRNLYSFQLERGQLEPLFQNIDATWTRVFAEINAFVDGQIAVDP